MLGCFITGSYINGNMMPNSDIDLFFVSEELNFRGRTYYRNIEFEYFVSPEKSYLTRLEKDLVSQQIYSSATILRDSNNILEGIQKTAREIVDNKTFNFNHREQIDLSFYIDTIMKDGIDLLLNNNLHQFYYFAGLHIPKFTDILCKSVNKYPLYEKNSLDKLKSINENYYNELNSLYGSINTETKLSHWIKLCEILLKSLGNHDVKEYCTI